MPSDAEALGQELRTAREARDLTLDQAEHQTRIRAKHLDSLERGDYAALPSAVQARGFLRNYARFLGLDADEMVARYDAAQGGRRRRSRARKPADPSMSSAAYSASYAPPAHERRGGSVLGRVLVGGVALIALVALLIAGAIGLQTLNASNNKPSTILSPAAPTPSPVQSITAGTSQSAPLRPTALPSPVGLATPTNVPGNTGTGNNNPPPANGAVAVSLQIVERTWLRVTVDGNEKYVGAPGPGTLLQYQGTRVQVDIANAAGVDATVNGRDLGVLGVRGQIVRQTFTINGASAATSNAPPATANSPGAAKLPTGVLTAQFVNTSPGATFSLTPTTIPAAHTLAASRTPVQATRRALTGTTSTLLPTFPPTSTFTATPLPTVTPSITSTPVPTRTPSITWTPSITFTPSITLTPSITPTETATPTATNTMLVLPHDTSTPEGGDIRPK